MGLKTLPHKVDPNEDVRDLSGGDCDAPIWLIVWYVWVCDESHIEYLLGKSRLQLWLVLLRYSADMVSTFP